MHMCVCAGYLSTCILLSNVYLFLYLYFAIKCVFIPTFCWSLWRESAAHMTNIITFCKKKKKKKKAIKKKTVLFCSSYLVTLTEPCRSFPAPAGLFSVSLRTFDSYLSLAGAATSIIFVATNVMSRQKYACCGKTFVGKIFLSRQNCLGVFVATRVLSRQAYVYRDKRRVSLRQK